MKRGNLLAKLPRGKGREVFERVCWNRRFVLERIVSTGQATPEGVWLRERRNEWVMVLQGRAALRFWGSRRLLRMEAGDYVLIPKNTRHRVEWTSSAGETVWLAAHF